MRRFHACITGQRTYSGRSPMLPCSMNKLNVVPFSNVFFSLFFLFLFSSRPLSSLFYASMQRM